MTNVNKLKIIFWNSHSLNCKLFEFKKYVYLQKPHIVCIQETWIKEEYQPSLINYRGYFQNREHMGGGGICTFIRNDVMGQTIELTPYNNGRLEIQCMKIMVEQNQYISIMNVYNANQQNQVVYQPEFNHYFNQLEENSILLGDFNAHHHTWNTRHNRPCNTGVNLLNATMQHNLNLLTYQNMPTYISNTNGTVSTIDLCFVSGTIFHKANIALGEDLGSDHAAIHVSIDIKFVETKFKMRGKWKFNRDKWGEFKGKLPEIDVAGMEVQEMHNTIVQNIVRTGEEVFGRTAQDVDLKFNKVWWTQECERAVRERKRLKNIFRRSPTIANGDRMREAANRAKQVMRCAKEERWKKYVGDINSTSKVGQVWDKVKKLSSTFKPHSAPIVMQNRVLTDNVDKCNAFAEYFQELYRNNRGELGNTQENGALVRNAIRDQSDQYNEEIMLGEMTNIITKLKGNSPGEDEVHNLFLKNLPDNYWTSMLAMFNKIWDTGEIPGDWKKALIVPIHKFGKSETMIDSFRPISLLPCIAKIMERIVCRRLYWWAENKGIMSKSQSGFRKRLSTNDQIARLEHKIRLTFLHREICMVVFIDLKSAYDKVNHKLLIKKLCKLGLKGKLLGFCKEFLTERKFRVLYNGEVSQRKESNTGVPQGGALSPLLFNLFISDLPGVKEGIQTEYADDMAILVRGHTMEHCHDKIRGALRTMGEYIKGNRLEVNYKKTVAMCFTRRKERPPTIYMDNREIKFVDKHKYLGVTLDAPHLEWKKHIEQLHEKGKYFKISGRKRLGG